MSDGMSFKPAGEEIFRISSDGEVWINPKYSVAKAAQVFWSAVISSNPFVAVAKEMKKNHRDSKGEIVDKYSKDDLHFNHHISSLAVCIIAIIMVMVFGKTGLWAVVGLMIYDISHVLKLWYKQEERQ